MVSCGDPTNILDGIVTAWSLSILRLVRILVAVLFAVSMASFPTAMPTAAAGVAHDIDHSHGASHARYASSDDALVPCRDHAGELSRREGCAAAAEHKSHASDGQTCCSFVCHFFALPSGPDVCSPSLSALALGIAVDEQVTGFLSRGIDRPPRTV